MKAIIVFLSLTVAVTLANVNCHSSADGFYCNANGGYTWCAGGQNYQMPCPTGTSCNCGTNVFCDDPCTMACEIGGPNAAQAFCQQRINSFGDQGYFCNSDGSGFYQCVRDLYCPSQASPRSAFQPCPLGAPCSCPDTTQECSMGSTVTPCRGLSDSEAIADCVGSKWDCGKFDNNPIVACAAGAVCNNDPRPAGGDYCFWHADTNAGICVENFFCDNPQCNHDSDCQNGWVCIINSCCGTTPGVCAAPCPFDK